MSNYNSENTTIMESHSDGERVHALMLHECKDGRYQYVIGHKFHVESYDGSLGYEHCDYSWGWGDYFEGDGALLRAVRSWESEVLKQVEAFTAEQAREGTVLNEEWLAHMEERIDSDIKEAMRSGKTSIKAFWYDRYNMQWAGGMPDAVVEELDRRYSERGFKLSCCGRNSYMYRVIGW